VSGVVVVTGAASGIGCALTTRLLALGYRVLATDVRLEALQASREAQRWPASHALLARLDVSRQSDWELALDAAERHFGPVDVLLNVAGWLEPGRVGGLAEASVRRCIEVNVLGVMFGTDAAARRMVARGRGHIVNVASLAGLAPVSGLAVYSGSKFAVRGFSLAAALDLRPHGVLVSVVCPDAVETPMLDLQRDFEEAAITFSGARALTVDEVCRAVVDEALGKRRLEVVLPRSRGGLARMAGAMPALAGLLEPLLRKRGLQAMRRRGGRHSEG
jgi:3-oxoacyl-[acyl-carrier protein] reductase